MQSVQIIAETGLAMWLICLFVFLAGLPVYDLLNRTKAGDPLPKVFIAAGLVAVAPLGLLARGALRGLILLRRD